LELTSGLAAERSYWPAFISDHGRSLERAAS